MSWRDGSSRASIDAAVQLGVRLEVGSKARNPRTMFFDGSVRSTRTISCSGRRRQLALGREPALARGELVELGRVDRDRVHRHGVRALVVGRRGRRRVDVRAGDVARGAHEFSAHLPRVEADHVVGEHPVVDRAPDPVGQHVPVVGLRPRDVDEVERAARPVARSRTSRGARYRW